MAANLVTGATVYADTVLGSYLAAYGIDNDISNIWASTQTAPPHWLAVDLGSGVTKIATTAIILVPTLSGAHLKDFKIQGSNNSTNGADGDWTDLYSGTQQDNAYLQKYTWSNSTGYRWYRVYATTTYRADGVVGIQFLQLFEDDLSPLMPFMTADNAPSAYVVGTSFTPYTGSYAYHGFDNIVLTGGQSISTRAGTTTGIVTVDLGAGNAKALKGYSLAPQYYSGGPARMCKSWTMEGSNNNSDWTTLDTQSNITDWSATVVKEFTVSNTTAYRYYRLNVTANNGDGQYLVISIIQLLGGAASAPPASTGIMFATFI